MPFGGIATHEIAPVLNTPSAAPGQSRPPTVYALRLLKLGDTWAAVSWLLQQPNVALSEQTRRRRSKDVRSFVEEILSLLATERRIAFTPGHGGGSLPEKSCYRQNYLPTKLRWRPDDGKVICVQFDGLWQAHRKNPREAEKERFLKAAGTAGFTVVAVGRPMTLAQRVAALAGCYCFVGVDSGMMHVAHSVACPRILVRNRMFQIDEVYGGKSLMVASNLDAALEMLFGAAMDHR